MTVEMLLSNTSSVEITEWGQHFELVAEEDAAREEEREKEAALDEVKRKVMGA